jgi:integrase
MSASEKVLALGTDRDVSLKSARERRDEARRLIAEGVDPGIQRKTKKIAAANTFKAIAQEWLELQSKTFSPATIEKARWTFEDLINPYIGSRPIHEITVPELLSVVRKLEARGKHETAHRTKQRPGQVIRYAIATGRAERDPSADLRGALAPIKVRLRPASESLSRG